MGFFSRGQRQQDQTLLIASSQDLTRIGRSAFAGQSPHPPGSSALSVGELDGYVMAAIQRGGNVMPGSPGWPALQTAFLGELTVAAERSGDWGFVGALCVAQNFVTTAGQEDPLFVAILDRATRVLRDDGVAFTAIPPFAVRRWEQVHGTDGLFPADWPKALEYLHVPAPGSEAAVTSLAPGESRRLAQPHAGEGSNVIYAERRPDGTFVAMIDGVDTSDGVHKRWEWSGVEAADYQGLLRELADRLVTQSHWAHDDLLPYFPCRARSRDEMRVEAANLR